MDMRFYDIHGILKVGSNFELHRLYKYFGVNFLEPDLTFLKTDFNFDKKNYQKAGLKFWGGDGKLYFESTPYGVPLQKILIENLEKKGTEVKFNRESKMFEISALMNLLLEIKLLQKGYTFVHGGGVSVDNIGYLICGLGESGKSSTTLKLCRTKGAKLLGDELVILSKKGYIYSFPTNLRIFSGSNLAKEIELSAFERIGCKFRYLFSKMPPLYFLVDANLRLDPERFTEVGEKAKLKKITLLQKDKRELRSEEIINYILNSTLPEFLSKFTSKVFHSYCYLNDFHFRLIRKMEEVLRSSIKGAALL